MAAHFRKCEAFQMPMLETSRATLDPVFNDEATMKPRRRHRATDPKIGVEELSAQAVEAEHFLKAMASKPRLMILCELCAGESSVTALQKAIGLSQSPLSQHLARLRADNLVKTRRQSQTIYYSLLDKRVIRVIKLLHELFCDRHHHARREKVREIRRLPTSN